MLEVFFCDCSYFNPSIKAVHFFRLSVSQHPFQPSICFSKPLRLTSTWNSSTTSFSSALVPRVPLPQKMSASSLLVVVSVEWRWVLYFYRGCSLRLITRAQSAWALMDQGYDVTILSDRWADRKNRITSQIAGALLVLSHYFFDFVPVSFLNFQMGISSCCLRQAHRCK